LKTSLSLRLLAALVIVALVGCGSDCPDGTCQGV
jgi:hypothetical protein